MKKKSLYFWGATFISAVAFSFASCSQEDDFIIDSGLDIDSQVPMTRSEAGDGMSFNPKYDKAYQIKDGECAYKTMIELKKARYQFTEDYTADDYLEKLRKKAVEMDRGTNSDPKDDYSGEGRMPNDLFLKVAQSEGLLQGKASNPEEYVGAKAVCVEEYNTQKGIWENHIGQVLYVATKKITREDGTKVKVAKSITYDSDKGCNQQTIDVDSPHFKHAWK